MGEHDDKPKSADQQPQRDTLATAIEVLERLITDHEEPADDEVKETVGSTDVKSSIPILDDVALPGTAEDGSKTPSLTTDSESLSRYDRVLDHLEKFMRDNMERVARETRQGVLAELRSSLETLLTVQRSRSEPQTPTSEQTARGADRAPELSPPEPTISAAEPVIDDREDEAPDIEFRVPQRRDEVTWEDTEQLEDSAPETAEAEPEEDELLVPGAKQPLSWESEMRNVPVSDAMEEPPELHFLPVDMTEPDLPEPAEPHFEADLPAIADSYLEADLPAVPEFDPEVDLPAVPDSDLEADSLDVGEADPDAELPEQPAVDFEAGLLSGHENTEDTLDLTGADAEPDEPMQESLFELENDQDSLSLSQQLGPDIDQFLAELEALKTETIRGTNLSDSGGAPPARGDLTAGTEAQPTENQALMDKTYDPSAIERGWYRRWEQEGRFRPSGEGEPYCIMLPPPNVTGSLHMGHAFQDTIMDALIRYHRMRGHNTLWQGGTDHAGIATQMVVERQLATKGSSRHQLGREAFEHEVWRWKAESGGTITQQLRRMGASLDWDRERFTLDEGLSAAVREVFVRLYDEGLIYRGKRLVNWDPVLHTAISDLEVISEEEKGCLWHLRYPLASRDGYLVVATTRPETMLGDVAVAVHPNDDRYRHLIGDYVELPLTDRDIPIIGDEYVDPDFGSGCVKITPAHDFNDYEIGLRHGLPMINVFTPDAALNENAPEAYQGLDRFEARKRIIDDLQDEGLLEEIEDYRLAIPRGDRTQAVCEPYLTDQWFVKIKPMAEPAIAVVEQKKIRFVPESYSKIYFEWMRNIQDWCISRQLWWGHRIPAWYDEDGKVYVGHSEDQVRLKYKLGPALRLRQDEDVLDTWFSSALWPFSTLGWPAKTPEFKTFYPTNVLVTGFDIIFFWVARMIMMGLKFAGDVPFREVYIHGLIRDSHGQKMSKSKGNVLDPIDLIDGIDLESLVKKRTTGLMRPEDAPKIEQATRKDFPDGIPAFGTDALRFTFASLATGSRDINFDTGRISGSRNFCNKIWNAARYVLNITADQDCDLGGKRKRFGLAERWIVSRLVQTQREAIQAIDSYRFDIAAQCIYSFIWDEYCDWFIEFSKITLNRDGESESLKRGTRGILLSVLEAAMRLSHPIMPFISEEIWQRLAERLQLNGNSIMNQPYPQPDEHVIDTDAISEFDWLKLFVLGVRRIRAENDIRPDRALPLLVKGGSSSERRWLAQNLVHINAVANTQSIRIIEGGEPPEVATALAGQMTILTPLADLIDREAEKKRLRREKDKLKADIERVQAKLDNDQFVSRAPAEVVAKERDKKTGLEDALERLQAQLKRIESMD
jgi:valyl-tRNA synthetase